MKIVIGGMIRSGSTLLFNIIKTLHEINNVILYKSHFYNEYCGGVDGITPSDSKDKSYLMKTHFYNNKWISWGDIIFTTRRDLRETVSSFKKWNELLGNKTNDYINIADLNYSHYNSWIKYSNYEFVYDRYINDSETVIKEIADIFKFNNYNSIKERMIINGVNKPNNLNHIRHNEEKHRTFSNYKSDLTNDEINTINNKHYDWLKKYNYIK